MQEIEVKIKWSGDAAEARARIEGRGYSETAPRTLEDDQLFDLESGELRKTDRLLRLRRHGARATVTFKGPATRESYKNREEIEFDVSSANYFEEVLARLEYRPTFRYQKYRTEFGCPGEPGHVLLDETPIGIFLELEGPKYWIDEAAERLEFHSSDFLTLSYGDLYQNFRRQDRNAPADMIFPAVLDF